MSYATDRVVLKVSGIDYSAQIVSMSWSIRNNARPAKTMTNDRTTQTVVLDNIDGDATVVEQIIQGVNTLDWFNFDWNDAILEVHPASDTYNAPRNNVVYNGQVRILNVLAADANSEDYSGTGTGATRTLRLLLRNASYQ